jgi:ribosome-binding factor A
MANGEWRMGASPGRFLPFPFAIGHWPFAGMTHREYKRSDRIAAELRREVAILVHDAVRDHALPSVSVSDVEVTRDLEHATVWVTALMGEQGLPAAKLLNELAKEFRRVLSRSMRLRSVPALHFRYDDSVDRGERIEQLLRDPR